MFVLVILIHCNVCHFPLLRSLMWSITNKSRKCRLRKCGLGLALGLGGSMPVMRVRGTDLLFDFEYRLLQVLLRIVNYKIRDWACLSSVLPK